MLTIFPFYDNSNVQMIAGSHKILLHLPMTSRERLLGSVDEQAGRTGYNAAVL